MILLLLRHSYQRKHIKEGELSFLAFKALQSAPHHNYPSRNEGLTRPYQEILVVSPLHYFFRRWIVYLCSSDKSSWVLYSGFHWIMTLVSILHCGSIMYTVNLYIYIYNKHSIIYTYKFICNICIHSGIKTNPVCRMNFEDITGTMYIFLVFVVLCHLRLIESLLPLIFHTISWTDLQPRFLPLL